MKLTPRQQFNIARACLIGGILFVAFTLFSCGSRKVNKTTERNETKQTEQTNTRTQEAIQETVTTTIDTTITTPERTSSYSAPLPVDAEPYIFEDDNIRSETSYNRNTGVLSNKVTVKPVKIPVAAKSVTERQINRNTDVKIDKVSESNSESKGKQVEREGIQWWVWLIVLVVFLIWAYGGWIIFGNRKKKQDDTNRKS